MILKVTLSVDEQGRIMMKIHPEMSTGAVRTIGVNSIPDKNTTEVVTQLLANDGQAILIGGLMKNVSGRSRNGVPYVSDIPIFGNLFSSTDDVTATSETVVIITPYIVEQPIASTPQNTLSKIDQTQQMFLHHDQQLENAVQSPTRQHDGSIDQNMTPPLMLNKQPFRSMGDK